MANQIVTANIGGYQLKTITLRFNNLEDRTLQITLPPDVPTGPLEIVLVIASDLQPSTTPKLQGRWRNYFSDTFDIDAALNEIRSSWGKEWFDE